MQTADFNHNDFSNQNEADKSLLVKFYYIDRPDAAKTKEMGRPMFKEVEFVEIRIAGQRTPQATRPATYADKQRFQPHYEAFKKRVEPPTEGMPLAEWPQMTRTQAEEMSFMNIKTVEQLATVKDANIQKFMNGYAMREKAQKWLVLNDSETQDREKEEMREQLAVQAEQIAQLQALLQPQAIEGVAEAGSLVAAQVDEGMASPLDEETPIAEAAIEQAAVPVPAAPAAKPRKKRPSRAKK
jgi:hypothetical protein